MSLRKLVDRAVYEVVSTLRPEEATLVNLSVGNALGAEKMHGSFLEEEMIVNMHDREHELRVNYFNKDAACV